MILLFSIIFLAWFGVSPVSRVIDNQYNNVNLTDLFYTNPVKVVSSITIQWPSKGHKGWDKLRNHLQCYNRLHLIKHPWEVLE